MKKISAIWILIVFMIFAAGCGNTDTSAQNASKSGNAKQSKSAAKTTQPKKVENKTPDSKTTPDVPKLQLSQKTISLQWIEDGKLRMRASASEFRGNEVTKIGELLNFSAQLYENGKLKATMSAPKATADTQKRIVYATGGVKMKSVERNTSLIAKKVTWYAKKQKVYGEGGVQIKSVMGLVTAAKFEADTALKTFAVKGQ